MSFLYFVPTGSPKVDVAAVGLAYAFEGEPVGRDCNGGPSGERGMVFTDATFERFDLVRGYFPESQTWAQIPGTTNWLGYYTDSPPTPEQLQRQKCLDGYQVEANGRKWLVPVARGLEEQEGELRYVVRLPSRATFNGDGEWSRGRVIDRYYPLWEIALEFWGLVEHQFTAGERGTVAIEYAREAEGCVAALQANYRVSNMECNALELLDDGSMGAILGALADMPTFNNWVKKKSRDAQPNIAAGAAG